MQQKIIQVGNSTGVIIPKSLLDQVGLQAGSEVEIEQDTQTNVLVISKKGQRRSSVSTRFLEILEQVNKKYTSALKELAEK